MQISQSCILIAFLALLSNAVVLAGQTKCQLSIEKATLQASNSHLRIRGHINAKGHCKPTSSDPGNVMTTVKFKAKKNVSFRDGHHARHSGNECSIVANWYNKPDDYKHSGKNMQVYVPLRSVKSIKCNKDSKHATKTKKSKSKTKKRTTKKSKKTTKKTTKKSSSGGSYNSHYSGQATFFTPDQGACGDWNDDSDYIAAIGGSLYGSYSRKSSYCGKKVKVVNKANGKSVIVTIKDACESCAKTHIDLSPAAFAKIGKFDTGILKVDWYIY